MKRELTVAVRAAKQAGSYLLKQYHSPAKIRFTHKTVHELVTKHDKRSEKMIMEILSKNFDYSMVTEESGTHDTDSEYTWFIDPIDGTTNFIHKYPYFSVSIGLAHKDAIILGVVYNPVRNELFYAVKGKGAFLNDRRIKVSSTSRIQDAILHFGFGYVKGKELDSQIRTLGKVKKRVHGIRRGGSAALDMCYVAVGRVDGFYEKGINMYDIAAAKIVVEEAGGQVSMMDGKRIKTITHSVCATNGKTHNQLLKLIK